MWQYGRILVRDGSRAKLSEAQSVADAVKRAALTPLLRPTSRSSFGSATATKSEEASAETRATPAVKILPVDATRHAIGSALVSAGHSTAAEFLGTASWTLDGATLRIEVPGVGKKMLALTVNAASEKIIRQELQRLNGPTRVLVVPGESGAITAEVISASVKGASKEVEEW